jgi:hypothetical protein
MLEPDAVEQDVLRSGHLPPLVHTQGVLSRVLLMYRRRGFGLQQSRSIWCEGSENLGWRPRVPGICIVLHIACRILPYRGVRFVPQQRRFSDMWYDLVVVIYQFNIQGS